MRLLQPANSPTRGLPGATRTMVRAFRDPAARRLVLQMREVFQRYRHRLAAIGMVAVRP